MREMVGVARVFQLICERCLNLFGPLVLGLLVHRPLLGLGFLGKCLLINIYIEKIDI